MCGNTLFYENTRCLSCGRATGWCPACKNVVGLDAEGAGRYRCGNPACRSLLVKCHNYAVDDVCNRCIVTGPDREPREWFCDCCRYNATIPDLSIPGNREKWYRLEVAKRRLFYDLNLLHLPYGNAADGFQPPLSFAFMGDPVPEFTGDSAFQDGYWSSIGDTERIYTGHRDGRITINLREADPVERMKLREMFGEVHRTLIGHFRHEIGHYYWAVLVRDRLEDAFVRLFGDYATPSYDEALERHYREGPPRDWAERFLSAYASMHPWEDFAETFSAYLDMASVLDTVHHQGLVTTPNPLPADFEHMSHEYQRLGIALNEVNRTQGLVDLVPEVLIPPVVAKLRFVHDAVRRAGADARRSSAVS